ncbi:uncharacterized, partial [Tachysurus ichikawai]
WGSNDAICCPQEVEKAGKWVEEQEVKGFAMKGFLDRCIWCFHCLEFDFISAREQFVSAV